MMQTDPLVSPAWLAARLRDIGAAPKNLVILDATLPPVGVSPAVDTRARYLAEHLPGAVFFYIEQHSDRATPLPHMLPPAEVFARSMEELGVGSSMTIVVYEQAGVFSAPRARWMLKNLGAKEVYLLDGGLAAWRAAGLATESGPVSRTPAEFHARLDRSAIRDYLQVSEQIARVADAQPGANAGALANAQTRMQTGAQIGTQIGSQILDARSAARFHGTAPEPRAGLASGHMPGSISLPYTELVEAGRLKSPAQLIDLFASHGIRLDQAITTTCGSGVTAAVIALALERAGAAQVTLYDGSWAEYAQQPGARIAQAKPEN